MYNLFRIGILVRIPTNFLITHIGDTLSSETAAKTLQKESNFTFVRKFQTGLEKAIEHSNTLQSFEGERRRRKRHPKTGRSSPQERS